MINKCWYINRKKQDVFFFLCPVSECHLRLTHGFLEKYPNTSLFCAEIAENCTKHVQDRNLNPLILKSLLNSPNKFEKLDLIQSFLDFRSFLLDKPVNFMKCFQYYSSEFLNKKNIYKKFFFQALFSTVFRNYSSCSPSNVLYIYQQDM
jgi:hypothetical protein